MAPQDVTRRPAAPPSLVLRYDDHPDAVIDVFLPQALESGPLPLAVVVHGGFWRQEWDRTHLRPLAWALAAKGFAVATPEYRRVGGRGGWPATGADVEAGLADVRGCLESAAPGRIDPARPVVLSGHSAGGHLAMWAGLRAAPHVVSQVVALAPVSDLVGAARLRLDRGAAQDLLGGEPEEVPDAYAAADPRTLLPGLVPVTVVHGDADQHVPVEMSRALAAGVADAATRDGFRYLELPGVDHFALIDPLTPAWPIVLEMMRGRDQQAVTLPDNHPPYWGR